MLAVVFAVPGGASAVDVVDPDCVVPALIGDAGANVINGTSGDDVICGMGGNDLIRGNGGNDRIIGGSGNDTLYGGGDADDLEGGDGNDRLYGGFGGDDLAGGAGSDAADYSPIASKVTLTLDGNANDGTSGEGDDIASDVERLVGGKGNDAISGNGSANQLTGGPGDDSLNGLGGDDKLIGRGGADRLAGGEGIDLADYDLATEDLTITVGLGANDGIDGEGDEVRNDVELVRGGDGDDDITGSRISNTLWGGAGEDELKGGGGSDRLAGGPGPDTFSGGSAPDLVDYEERTADITASIGGGADDGAGDGGEGDNVGTDVEYLRGGSGDDDLTGSPTVNILYGGEGDDDLHGLSGDDQLLGGMGGDMHDGGDGLDTVTYADVVTGAVTVSIGNGAADDGRDDGAEGDEVTDDIEKVVGTKFADTLTAAGTSAMLDGGDGADTLNGGSQLDILIGGAGQDAVTGGGGSDGIFGGADADFIFAADGEADEVDCGLADDAFVADPGTDTLTACENEMTVALGDTATTDEDSAVDIDVLANDRGVNKSISDFADPAAGGTLSVVSGKLRFTPSGLDSLAAGSDQVVNFGYTLAGDYWPGTDAGAVALTVTGVNDAPAITHGATEFEHFEDSTPTQVDPAVSFSDVDSGDEIESVEVKISDATRESGDSLAAPGTAAKFDSAYSDGTLTLTEKAGETASTADWISAAQAIQFDTTNNDPSSTRAFAYAVNDGDADGTSTRNMTVHAANDDPSDIALDPSSVAENSGSAASVGTLTTTDPDDTTGHTYTLEDNAGYPDNASFTIDGDTLKTAADFNHEAQDSYLIKVRSTDPGSAYTEKPLTVTVTDVNEAPSFTSGASPSVAENTTAAQDVDADDPEGGSLTYSITGGADAALFSINTTTGALTFNAAPNYEAPADADANNIYGVQVTASDGTHSPTQDIAVTVTDVSEAPTGLTLDDDTIDENHPAGTIVGTASASDPESDTLTYSKVAGAGDADNDKFQFTGADLETAVANLDHEDHSDADDDGNYQVRYQVSDGTNTTEATATITVNDLNDAPTQVDLDSNTVAENQPSGTTVGLLTTDDQDAGQSHAYTLAAGSADNDSFAIDGNALKTAASFDYEADNSYSIQVTSTDDGTPAMDRVETLTVSVTNVNEAPAIGGLESADLAYVENEDKQLTNALTLSDPESDTISSATVQVTTGRNSAEDRLKFTDSSTVVKDGDFDTSTGTLTLKGKDGVPRSLAAWETALRAVTYENLSQDPDETKRTIQFRVTDTGTTAGSPDPLTSAPVSRDATVDRVNDAPVADHETAANKYPGALGNTRYVMSATTAASGPHTRNGASGDVLDGDTDPDTPVADLTAGPATITSAGCAALNASGHACANNVAMESDGEFVYDPPAGYTGDDSFSYTVSDNDTGDGDTAKTNTGNVEADVAGPVVWYVDKDASTTGHGTSHAPLPDLPRLNPGTANTIDGRDGTGDRIFVYHSASNYTGGIQLEASQALLGEPNGLSVQHSETNATHNLVSSGGANPTITNASGDAINLANDVEVQRVNIGTTSHDGIDGTNITNATIGNNMSFSGVAGTDFRLSGGNGAVNIASPITNTAGRSIHVENRTGGSVQFNADVTDTGEGIFLDNNDNTIINLPQTLNLTIDTAHEAFAAEDGGTVMAPNANNTIAHTGGARAIRVENTDIGAGGLDFRSVSSNGGPNGIKLLNTGTTAGLSVHGNSNAADTAADGSKDGTGGTIQNTTSHAIELANTKDPLFDNLNITGPNRAGVKGTEVQNFSYTDGVLTNVGDSKVSEHDAAFAFNPVTSNVGDIKGDRISGTFTVKRNNVQSPYGGGVAVRESDSSPALTDVQVTDNTFQSATAHADSQGDGISFYVEGDGANVGRLNRANLSTNVIRNFPNGQGIELIGGNIDSVDAPRGSLGVPGSSTNKIVVDGNLISGDATNKMAAFGIAASVSGRSEGNVEITNNGTLADPVANMIGEGIAAGASGDSTATFVMTGNVVRPNNNLGNVGMSVNGDKRAFTAGGELMTPNITTTIANNNIAMTSGAGIHLKNFTSNATHRAKVMNNTVNTLAAPTQGNPGIRIENGSTNDAGFNPTLCVQAENNNTTGSATSTVLNAGIHILNRRAGTGSGNFYPLQIVGFGQTDGTGQAAVDYLETKNPQSSSYAPIAGSFSIVSNPNKRVTSATSGSGSPTFDSCNAF